MITLRRLLSRPNLSRVVFAVFLLPLLAALNALAATSPQKYVVGYATFTARIVPLWLAQEQGFFSKYGIEVEPVFIRGVDAGRWFSCGQHARRPHGWQRHARRGRSRS